MRLATGFLSVWLGLSSALTQTADSSFTVAVKLSSASAINDTSQQKTIEPLSFERFYQRKNRYPGDPSSVRRIYTHDELMRYYHGDFADLLWNIAGMYIHDAGSYGKPISASSRGLGPAQLLILYDGQPLQEPDLPWLNLNIVSLEDIQQIEILDARTSALYGRSGLAINIVPKTPRDGEALTTIKFRSVFSDFQDIGAYFGRTIGQRLMVTVGGSHRETPGEQRYQQLTGGYLSSIQETRYNGNTIFASVRYLISPRWLAGYRYQTLNEKYDAYGPNRNGAELPYRFRTPGGLRKDERNDYRLWTEYNGNKMYFRSALEKTETLRRSLGFQALLIPPRYMARLYHHQSEFGGTTGQHHWLAHLSAGVYRGDSLPGTPRKQTDYILNVSDRWRIGRVQITGLLGYTGHSRYAGRLNALSQLHIFLKDSAWWTFTGSRTHRFPSPLEEARHPQFFSQTPYHQAESVSSLSSELFLKNYWHLDQIRLSIFVNRIQHAIEARPFDFFSDTLRLLPYAASLRQNMGADIELTRRYRFLTFILQQSLITGQSSALCGVPYYRAHLLGMAEYDFFNKNLRMNGVLSVKYFSRHPGYSYQDAPMRYYPVNRHSGGGFIVNTRVSATIGDFRLFYEAENILRARFTLLDGYDITPQQWRFGMIWNLYN